MPFDEIVPILKECPFCGTVPNYETFHDGFARFHRIECPSCKFFIDRFEKDEVIADWNTRAEKKLKYIKPQYVEITPKHVIQDGRCVRGIPDCRGCYERCLEVHS